MKAADDFRDEILSLTENTLTDRFRARLVPQRELLHDGVRLARLMRKSGDPDRDDGSDDTDPPSAAEGYYGGKWGIHLRAPDLWFEIMDRFSNKFARFGDVADIRRGVTSGKDGFFLPRDASAECLKNFVHFDEFRREFGVTREDVETGVVKLVRCGDSYGEIRPIEAQYLEPEVHSLMEVNGYTVRPEDCARMILLVDQGRKALSGRHVLKYIEWGESKGWHRGATCAARVTETREWYDLTGHKRGKMFWPKSQQYRHCVPFNDHELQANCNLYDITPASGVDAETLAGILNSSWAVLSKFQYGRPVGNEGNLKTEVVDMTMMPVPDPRGSRSATLTRVLQAFRELKKRPALQFLSERRMRRMSLTKMRRETELTELSDLSELSLADRCALDDAVLEMLGINAKRERDELIARLYLFLGTFFEDVRQKEEKAIGNKNKSKRRGAAIPSEIALQILADIKENNGQLLRSYRDFLDLDRPFDTLDLPPTGDAEVHDDMFAPHGSVRFMKGRKQISLVPTRTKPQAALVAFLAASGIRSLIRVPIYAEDCLTLCKRYVTFIDERARRLRTMIEDRTGDEDIQDQIFAALNDLILHETCG